jgi:hypothetical protein
MDGTVPWRHKDAAINHFTNHLICYRDLQTRCNMDKKKVAIGLIIIFACAGAGLGIYVYYIYSMPLSPGQDPSLNLPFTDSSHLEGIQGFGQINPTYYHNGIDFMFNDTTQILAAYGGSILEVKFWYNDKGGHWQTNVRIQLNTQWTQESVFESWAVNQTDGQLQADAILVKAGDKVQQGQALGNLLHHGTGCHVHFGLLSNNNAVCPYTYFSAPAKATFDGYFTKYNYTAHACV